MTAATTTTPASFAITDASSNTFTYEVDANAVYWDADTQAAGSSTGIVDNVYALVGANLNADGTLYARRVFYAASASTLPTWTPEGLVRRVMPGSNSFKIYAPAVTATAEPWRTLQTVTVDASTVWTFHTSVTMGTGTGYLADIWRGCRVDVVLNSTTGNAASVNVESAYDEGSIGSATPTGVTFGFPLMAAAPPPWRSALPAASAIWLPVWNYYQNASDTTNAFTWWYSAFPPAPTPPSRTWFRSSPPP